MTSPASTNRVWLITGASSGFGRAIAEAAAAAGDTVAGAVRQPSTMDDLAAAHPGRVSSIALDVTDTGRAADAVAEVISRHGRIDVLVNNAGRGFIGAVEETTEAEFRDLMDLHFFGPVALIRAVLPHMRRRGSGAIVQMSSMGGRFSFPGCAAYSATKFALEGLSEALAEEAVAFGIRVLIVEPGAFRTGFAGAGALQPSAATMPEYEDTVGTFRQMLPTTDGKQPGDPAKAAAAIIAALDADKPPLRLVLGNDSFDMVSQHLSASQQELLAWEPVARGTDFG
jgi:NAD(P)-dependent dehydrogenase (short-subunit alcohol dehydrogenase family)